MSLTSDLAKRIKQRKLPNVDAPQVDDQSLRHFLEGVKEHLRMYEGDSGAPKERFVTIEELEAAGIIGTEIRSKFALITEANGIPVGDTTAGSGSSGATTLAALDDTSVTGISNGSGIVWNGAFYVPTELPPFNAAGANKYDMLFKNTTAWEPTNSVLQWNPDLGFMQFANAKAINWLTAAGVSTELLVLQAEVAGDPLYDEVVLLVQFDGVVDRDVNDWGTNIRSEWVFEQPAPIEYGEKTAMSSTGITQGLNANGIIRGFDFSPDGLHAIVQDSTSADLCTYVMDTAFSVESATADSAALSYSGKRQPHFCDSGNKFFMNNTINDSIEVFATNSAYTVTSVQSVVSTLAHPGNGNGASYDMSDDGFELVSFGRDSGGGAPGTIWHWTLGTAFDVSTAVFQEKIDVSAILGAPAYGRVNIDGTAMVVHNIPYHYLFNMSVPWDVSTATLDTNHQYLDAPYELFVGPTFNDDNLFITPDSQTMYIWSSSTLDPHIYKLNRNLTNYTEESTPTKAALLRNKTEIDQTISKYGDGSGAFGNGRYDDVAQYGNAGPNPSFMLDGGLDFCIEGQVYFDALETVHNTFTALIFHSRNIGLLDKNFEIGMRVLSGSQYFYVKVGTTAASIILPTQPVVDTWYHFSIQRRGANLDLLWNGDRVLNVPTFNFTGINDPDKPIDIGGWETEASEVYTRGLTGNIDQVRFTNGSARYPDATTYTVPTGAFPAGPTPGNFVVGDPSVGTTIEGSSVNITAASTDIDGTLNVDGATTLIGDLDVTGDTSLTTLDTSGLAQLATLQVVGIADFDTNVDINNGGLLTIWDVTNVDSAQSGHDGTDFNTTFTGTTDWNVTGLTQHLKIDSSIVLTATTANVALWGGDIYLYDDGITDYGRFGHDGTDFNSFFFNTTDWNITGGVVLKLFDSGTIGFAAFNHDGTDFLETFTGTTRVSLSGAGQWELLGGMNAVIRDAGMLFVYDAVDTNYFRLSHNGTDATIFAQGTTDLEISGFTGALDVLGGTAVRIRDSANTSWLSEAAGADTFTSTFVSMVDWDVLGLTGEMFVDADLRVSGDLTASGTLTSINTSDLNIADNLILLNSTEVGAPTLDAGIEIERGTSTNVQVLWNETSDEWTLTNDGITWYPILTENFVVPGTVTDNTLRWSGTAWVEASLVTISEPVAQALTGTVSVTAATAAVVGVGTLFTTELSVNDSIKIAGELFSVATITDALNLTLNSNHSAGASAVTAYSDGNLFAISNADGGVRILVAQDGTMRSDVFNGTNYIKPFRIADRDAMRADGGYAWLYLNGDEDFANGVYTPGLFRADGGLQVGSSGSAFNVSTTGDVSLASNLGDRIGIYGALDVAGSYGIGIEASTQYYKAGGNHRWYISLNADGGVLDRMNLDINGLEVKARTIRATDTAPRLSLYETGAAADEATWEVIADGGALIFWAANDAYSAATNWMTVNRSGNTPTFINMLAPVTMSTTLDVTGAVTALSYGGITEANLLDKTGVELLTGDWTVTTGNLGARRGFHGDYASTGAASTWGATMWAIDHAFDGDTAGVNNLSTALYGTKWLRASHTEADANVGEGMYWYANGVQYGGLGPTGIAAVKGTFSGAVTGSNLNPTNWDTAYSFTNSLTATAAEINLLDLAGLTIGWVLSADSGTTASWKAPSAGSGTVTDVSVVTANGVSGSVATSTTTPAITLTLGAITPASVASVGAVTGSNLSGSNTGDNAGVTNVNDGNGMTFTAITGTGDVTMGTPGSLTGSTSNAVTADSHTHAITSITAAKILAGDLVSGVNIWAATSVTASSFKVPFLNTTASTSGAYGLLQDSSATFVYNPSTNQLTCGTFSGTLSGNASTATTATNATNSAVTTSTAASAFKIPFANTTASTTGNYGLLQDSTATFTYNPSTNVATAVTWNATSDARIKKNIEPYIPVHFDFKAMAYDLKNGVTGKVGYIAQDVVKELPDAVTVNDDGMMSLDYTMILVAKIAELEARLDAAGL